MNVSHVAEWISWIGVGVAAAGILIAAPDGAALIWRRSIRTVRTALRRGQSVTATAAVAMAKATVGARASVRKDWEPDAGDSRKIEVLHRQVDLLTNQVDQLVAEIDQQSRDLRTDLDKAAQSLQSAHDELARRFDATEKRTVQVDARGLWPVGFGIVLTGIPSELASWGVVGWLVVGTAVGWTLRAAWQVFSERRGGRTAV